MRGDRKTEARIHAARIPLDRGIDEILNAGELDDFVELLPDEGHRHAHDGAPQKHILTAGEVLMEAGGYPR